MTTRTRDEWYIKEICRQTGASEEEVEERVEFWLITGEHKPVVNKRMGKAIRRRIAVERKLKKR